MRISTIATPLEASPVLKELKIGSSAYVALPVRYELGEKDKGNDDLTEVRALYVCLPGSRQARAIAKFIEDTQNPANPALGLKLNCLGEILDKYAYNSYTGASASDPDPTAKEVWYKNMRTNFIVPGTEEIYDMIVMNGEVDALPLASWGKRTLVTFDSTQIVKDVSKAGKPYIKTLSAQYSMIDKQTVWQSMIMFPQGDLVTATLDKLPTKSVVALEGRLQKNTEKGMAILADAVIPIRLSNSNEVEPGEADSDDASVRTNAYAQQSTYGSVEDY